MRHGIFFATIITLIGLRSVSAFPSNIIEADTQFTARSDSIIQWWLQNHPSTNYGSWQDVDTSMPKIAALLSAIKSGQLTYADTLGKHYPKIIQDWIWSNVVQFEDVGTDPGNWPEDDGGNYDFQLSNVIPLLYLFKNDPGLLTDSAVQALVCEDWDDNSHDCVDGATFGAILANENSDQFQVTNYVFGISTYSWSETENHLLMIYTWKYLINQWIHMNPRSATYVTYDPSFNDNEGGLDQNFLLVALGRIVNYGYFETNARAYESFSLLPILELYSFADTTTDGGKKIRIAAENALDYTAAQFAFQSLQCKRYGPSRRHLDYDNRPGVYQNEYVPFMFGALSGAHAADYSPNCDSYSTQCPFDSLSTATDALWASLLSYRIPDPILDFYIRKDNHKPGYGAWARMQSRFTNNEYYWGDALKYLPGDSIAPPLYTPNLDSLDSLVMAPEYYFMTNNYMNSAGGHYVDYTGELDVPSDPGPGPFYDYDRFTKSTALIPTGDNGQSDSIEGMRNEWMMMKGYDAGSDFSGNTVDWWNSKGLGVYKNMAYGYSGHDTVGTFPYYYWIASDSQWAMSFPSNWNGIEVPIIDTLLYPYAGADTFTNLEKMRIFPMTSTNSLGDSDLGFYIVALNIKPDPFANGYWGIWEIVPESKFPTNDGLIELADSVYDNMINLGEEWDASFRIPVYYSSSSSPPISGTVDYISIVSGERVSFQLGYGVGNHDDDDLTGSNAVVAINSDSSLADSLWGHMNLNEGDKNLPLIEVQQVDSNYQFTGVKYVTTDNKGKIVIWNPFINSKLTIDESDLSNPKHSDSIGTYYIYPDAPSDNPDAFSSWPEAYTAVSDSMAQRSAFGSPIQFIYISPSGSPVNPPADSTYTHFILNDDVGTIPFTLLGTTQFPE